MGFDWLSAIFGEKKIHLNFLNFRRSGDNTKTKTRNISRKKTTNESGQVYEAPVTQVINNGPVINFNVQLGPDGTLSEQAIEALKPIVAQFENKQVAVLATDAKKILSDITQHEENPDVRGLLKFFKHRLSPMDYQRMRTGLYLKFLRDNNRTEEVKLIWSQLQGQQLRDRRIIELASAEYFHTFFRPFFKQLIKADAAKAQVKFDKEFEAILSDMRFAIFVHSGMKEEDIIEKVMKQAISNIKYGVKANVISLHATGTSQVKRVKKAVTALRTTFPVINVSSTPKGSDIIKVDIEYRKNDIDEKLLEDDLA